MIYGTLVSILLTILFTENMVRLNDMCQQLQLVPELEFDLILSRFNFPRSIAQISQIR